MSKKQSNPAPPSVGKKPKAPPAPPGAKPGMVCIRVEALETINATGMYVYFHSDYFANAINTLIQEGRIKL